MAGGVGVDVRVWAAVVVMVGVMVAPAHTDNLGQVVARLLQSIPAYKHTIISQTHRRPQSTRLQERSGTTNEVVERFCFGELGCIETGPDFFHPQRRPFNMAPDTREEIQVLFTVRSREDPRGVVVPGLDVPKILTSSFSSHRHTKLVVHGYLNGRDMPWLTEIMDAYLKAQDVNVIYVEWTGGSIGLYPQAVSNARVVGLEIAHLINWLKDNTGLNPRDVHIIGHSLGAHVAGYAGERAEGLGRITGLDPAEPEFQHMPPSVRLDPSDAIFVDVIHTDAGTYSLVGGYGLIQPVGHLDFYPNGGTQQPGCDGTAKEPLWPLLLLHNFTRAWRSAEESVGCNHVKAATFFVDSILSSCPYVAFECSSYEQYRKGKCFSCGSDGSKCASMGDGASNWPALRSGRLPPAGLKLYLATAVARPFCLYHYKLRVEVGPSGCGVGYLNLTFVSPSGSNVHFDLTRRSPKRFEASKTYSFILEHGHDLGLSEAVLVTWNQLGGDTRSCNTSHPAALPLTGLSIMNLETTVQRQLSGRSLSLASEMNFCPPGGGGITWVNNGETEKMSAAAHCSSSASSFQ